jgi:hypothetical protein
MNLGTTFYKKFVVVLVIVASCIKIIAGWWTPSVHVYAAADQATFPSVVVGSANSCGKNIFTIKHVNSCERVPLDPNETLLVQNAIQDLNTVLKSEEFKRAVLDQPFDARQMIRNCDGDPLCKVPLTKEQIYEVLVSTSPEKINVTFYQYGSPFTRGNEGFEDSAALDTVFGNRKKIAGNRGFLASLILHEIMHLQGFQHLDDKNRCSSVPYGMNSVYTKVSAQLHLTSPVPCR